MSDTYGQWRDEGCPCGRRNCEFYTDDHEAQNCDGMDGAGDPAVASCRGYVPDPLFVSAWAVQEDGGKDNPLLAELLDRLTPAEAKRDHLKERVMDWQPIETAPKTPDDFIKLYPNRLCNTVLVGKPDRVSRDSQIVYEGITVEAEYRDGKWMSPTHPEVKRFLPDDRDWTEIVDVTHWMPLPQPPEE